MAKRAFFFGGNVPGAEIARRIIGTTVENSSFDVIGYDLSATLGTFNIKLLSYFDGVFTSWVL